MKEKLLAIQRELKVPKNRKNSFGKYNYRSGEDILEAVKPLLEKHKVNLVILDELVLVGERYYVKASAELMDIGTNDKIAVTGYAREEESKKGMDGSQITGTSSSYARKYALNGLFLIDDTKDEDSLNDHTVKTEQLVEKLTKKLESYTDPQKLDADKIKIRDEYVKLGLGKKEATEIVMEYINGL